MGGTAMQRAPTIGWPTLPRPWHTADRRPRGRRSVTVTGRRMTLEEFLRLPEEEPPLEYWDENVTRKVSPQGKHGRLETKFAERVNRFAEPLRLAMAITELRATFGGGSPVPDVAVYRWDRVPLDPDGAVADVFLEA